jgi:hypothetical protein
MVLCNLCSHKIPETLVYSLQLNSLIRSKLSLQDRSYKQLQLQEWQMPERVCVSLSIRYLGRALKRTHYLLCP